MHRLRLLPFALFLAAAPAPAADLRAVDGGRFIYNGETFRIANITAPDMTLGACDAERRLGKVAKARLDALLVTGRATVQRGDTFGGPDKNDKGESLGTLTINGKDIGKMLIEEHMAKPAKSSPSAWCKD